MGFPAMLVSKPASEETSDTKLLVFVGFTLVLNLYVHFVLNFCWPKSPKGWRSDLKRPFRAIRYA
jgi:hypothetical protein